MGGDKKKNLWTKNFNNTWILILNYHFSNTDFFFHPNIHSKLNFINIFLFAIKFVQYMKIIPVLKDHNAAYNIGLGKIVKCQLDWMTGSIWFLGKLSSRNIVCV